MHNVFSEALQFPSLGPPSNLATGLGSHPDITVPKLRFEVLPDRQTLGSLSWGGGFFPAADCCGTVMIVITFARAP